MAGMFYLLKEVAEKLNKTEEEVREIVRQGRLREFREGPNSLFKADEVEALMSDTTVMPSKEPPAPSEQKPSPDEISLAPEPAAMQEPTETPVPTETPELIETPEPTETPSPVETPMPTEAPELIETPEPIEVPELIETPEPAVTPEPTAAPEPTKTPEPIEVPELIETPEPTELPITAETPAPPETPVPESDLTSADTAITGVGFDVLDETGSRAQATDDTVIEAKDTTAETPLQEIEEDVNLDSFGSGSGLLDLSLQADDTSLGGILDEIYAPEAGEGQLGEAGSAVEMAAEVEQMLPGGGLAAPGPAPGVPAIAQAYVEPEPDTVSNAMGVMLFLPLLAIIYTAIVAVTGFSDVMPSILEKIQAYIWYVMGGTAVVAVVIIAMAFMLGSKGAAAGKKPKAKKAKEAPPPAPEDAAA